ncbi:MAG TPA: phosphoribosylformylglycinamidine synthase I [Candidatus Omnitrophota bacterium]|nr:phosphoribosylformylglycinamidine synthase I [Candidatus Omnitrophota bacterium]
MTHPNVCVVRTAGTNCDKETAFTFEQAGARAELVHINALIDGRKSLEDYHILALPGGFSYGDDIAAGKVEANELRYKLADALKRFVSEGKLIIGICNGFQILVKSGFLPGNPGLEQETSLIINDCGSFRDEWVYLKSAPSACVWTRTLPEVIALPIAHGEGKFVTRDVRVLERIKENRQIVFQYCDADGALRGFPFNPNGSLEHIAGICDATGRILGLMPHPERHMVSTQHPRWNKAGAQVAGDGFFIFKNGVEYAAAHL